MWTVLLRNFSVWKNVCILCHFALMGEAKLSMASCKVYTPTVGSKRWASIQQPSRDEEFFIINESIIDRN